MISSRLDVENAIAFERKFLTCPVCSSKQIKLSEYWGCPNGMSHTRIMSDAHLLNLMDKEVSYDGTPHRSVKDDRGNVLYKLDGHVIQCKRLLRLLLKRCGFKKPSLSTTKNYVEFCSLVAKASDETDGNTTYAMYKEGYLVAFDAHAIITAKAFGVSTKKKSFVIKDQKSGSKKTVDTQFFSSGLLGENYGKVCAELGITVL